MDNKLNIQQMFLKLSAGCLNWNTLYKTTVVTQRNVWKRKLISSKFK